MTKRLTDETARYAMPLAGKDAAPGTAKVDVTQKFDPGFSRRPAVLAVPPRDETR